MGGGIRIIRDGGGGTGRIFAYHEVFGSFHSPTKSETIKNCDSSITGWLRISGDLRHVTW